MPSIRISFCDCRGGVVATLLLLLLISGLIFLLPRAWEKMIDYAALSEMKQTAIYSGRTLKSYWGMRESDLRTSLTLNDVHALIGEGPFVLHPKVTFTNESFEPDGHLHLRHERFGERSFFFDYEGERLPHHQ